MRCIVHKTRPCVQDDRVGSHFDLSRIIDKQVAGAIRLRNTRPRKSCAIRQGPLQQFPQAKASDDAPPWECPRSEPCGEPCHLPSSAGNTVTMELATVNDENPCGDRGLDAVCPPVALDGTDGEKWRRRESNPRVLFSDCASK